MDSGTLKTMLKPVDETTASVIKIKLHVVFPPPDGKTRETVSNLPMLSGAELTAEIGV